MSRPVSVSRNACVQKSDSLRPRVRPPPGCVEHFQVVSRFRITVSEHTASGGFFEYPNLGSVTLAPEVGGNTGRAKVHIRGECGRRRAARQPALLPANLRQRQAEPAEFRWHRGKQILGLAELVEILEKEPVLPVVPRGALGTALPQVIGQHRTN